MAPKPANRIGLRYGKFTVVGKPAQAPGDSDPKFRCLCDCGNEKLIARSNLASAKSCGCNYSRYGSLRERLESQSIPEPNSGCWLWLGGLTNYSDGRPPYGKVTDKHKSVKAHRASYQTYKGPIPANALVCHSCDNTYCINPDHLFLGTPKDNSRDRDRKQRRSAPKGTLNGFHILTEEKVKMIKSVLGTMTQTKIADIFGIEQSTISLIKLGKRWKHVA